MELNFSETAKSNIMSSTSTFSFAAAALNTGADEDDFARHLDDEANGNHRKDDKFDESALDRADEARADRADEAKADEKRADEKRADDNHADKKKNGDKQASDDGLVDQTSVNLNSAVDPATITNDTDLTNTDLTDAEIVALEAEQAELAASTSLSAQEEDADALAALSAQENITTDNDEQNNAAVGIVEATVAQTTSAATIKETTQSTANVANAADATNATDDEDGLLLNLKKGEGDNADNTGKKTLGQQAAEKLASARAKTGDASPSNEKISGKSGNTPAAVSNLISSKETTQATNAMTSAAASNSVTSRSATSAQSFNALNFENLAGMGSNQSTSPQNSSTVLIRVGTLPGQTQPSQVPSTAIAMQMNKNIQKGISNFEIRLDPAELGRVDVKMEISTDGRLTAHMVVESAETLDLLRKDAQALEKALSDAGLDMDEEGMTFSLSEDNQQTASQEAEGDGNNTSSSLSGQETGAEDDTLSTAPTYYFSNNTSGVDIRV
ncbi:MAG: flagellar hook-length control protein FliK [Parvibaculaceae bacterium]|nr:flagellar hook-length control protein FliK [Parvibaculaceae bacterium]